MLQNTLAQEGGGYSGGALIGGAYSGGCAPRKPRISPWDRMTDEQYDAAILKSKVTKARRKKEREAALSGQGFGYRGGAGAEDRANYLAGVKGRLEESWANWEANYLDLFDEIGAPAIPLGQRDKTCIRKKIRDLIVGVEPEYVTKKMLRSRQGQV